jgi:hypothetical protein
MFLTQLLTRTNRVEKDLVDELFNSRAVGTGAGRWPIMAMTQLGIDNRKSDSGTDNCKSQKCRCARQRARF